MEVQVYVEDTKADITDLKNLLAVSESENKCFKQEQAFYSGRGNVQQCKSISALRKLFEKNEKRLLCLTELEDTLTKRLLKVCAELSAVDDELSKVVLKSEQRKHYVRPHLVKFGTPYFRHNDSRPTNNSDVLLLRKLGDISYVDMPKPLCWMESEKKRMVKAIESEERYRQMKDVEIEKLKVVKKMQFTHDADERMEFRSERDQLEERSSVIKYLRGSQLFKDGSLKYDWLKISVVDLKGNHSPQECQAMWTNYLNPFINKGRWKKDEDDRLELLVEKHKFSNWDTIAVELNTHRSAFQCMCHYQNRLNPRLVRSVWVDDDDHTLRVLIKTFRKGDYIPWKKIAYCFSNCSVSNVVTRWKTIDPDVVKGKFSETEDVILVAAVRKFGKDFKKIADHFPGRTSTQLHERYKSFLRNDRNVKPWSPDEDRLIWDKVKEFGHDFSHISTFFINRNRTQIRHRYYRMQHWVKKHPGQEYPACRSGQFKITEGPDELWRKVVNVMRDKKVKFNEVDGDAIMDDDSFSSLKNKLKLKKKCEPKTSHQRTFNSVDLELSNFFCSVYPQNGGRYKIHYTDEEIDRHSQAMSKFLEFLCVQLRGVSENEIDSDKMLSRLDQLVLKNIYVRRQCENSPLVECSAGASVGAERTLSTAENYSSVACSLCNIKHSERSYVNVWHNAVPPNQTSLIGIRSIMLWRSILRSMSFPPEIKTEHTSDESDQYETVVIEANDDADEECSECIKEAKAVFVKHSDIWKARFQSVFAWAALCSESAPTLNDTCHLNDEFNEINVANRGELMEHLKNRECKMNIGRTQRKRMRFK